LGLDGDNWWAVDNGNNVAQHLQREARWPVHDPPAHARREAAPGGRLVSDKPRAEVHQPALMPAAWITLLHFSVY
jgi:hypothetical protein